MAEVLNKSEDLWSSYKTLKRIIWKSLSEDYDENYAPEFENLLRKHKQNFFALLHNQPKHPSSREELKKGMVDGIMIKGLGHQILSKELYQEAIILSDMYDMNEFVALDLLCTAQIQMSFYPGLPRGLVAILLYYDGRKALLSSLRYLVQARTGVQWSLNIKPDMEKFITQYTDQLMKGGLFNRIYELLRTLDLSKELEKLQENLALGGPRHRRQVIELFEDIRVILADIVFIWATQTGLPKAPMLGLIHYLRNVELEEDATGKIDTVNLYMQMALLAALDLSALHSREDGEEAIQKLPILADVEFITAIINELQPTKAKWKVEGLQAVSTFGLAVCLASMRVLPQNQQFQDAINKEEFFVDTAIELNVFQFLHNTLLDNKDLYKEQFLFKRFHNLITDFIVYMYSKVKELRMKSDEISRTVQIYSREGLEAPAHLSRNFEYFLMVLTKFYSKTTPENKDLVMQYWNSTDTQSSGYSGQRSSPRTATLFKFVRLSGELLPTTLFVPYIKMLAGLSSCSQAARHCFNMLKQVGPQLNTTLSWDHFFASFAQYYNNLRQELPPVTDTVYRNQYLKGVSPQELEGLHAVLLLIRTIADNDEFSRLALCEHPGWAPLTILLGLVGCSVPIPLKSDLLSTLASLSKSAENASQMWENLEASQILITVPTTSSYVPRGLQTELDEVESRMEEYPLTKSLLKLLDVLTDFGIPRTLGAGPRKPGFDPYLQFIIDSVFLRCPNRCYRNPTEKWEIYGLCLKLFEKFLSQYDPQISDFPKKNQISEFNPPPGYHLMVQLNNKSELLNVILDIIDEGMRLFDSYVAFNGFELVEEATLKCMNIIYNVLALQPKFLTVLTTANASLLLTNLTKLLITINRRSGKPDHCVNIGKYLSYQPFLWKHGLIVVKILQYITSTPVLHNQFIQILLTSDNRDDVKNGFVLLLDSDIDYADEDFLIKTKIEILKLLKQCLIYNSPNLSHFLLGFDMKRDISKTEFQYSGVLDFPRSCLHSIITMIESEVNNTQMKYSQLLEAAYEMIYLLSSSGNTSGPVLRFIRLNKTFFINHMELCWKNIDKSVTSLNQLSWLMKTLAIELKICSETKQLSYLKQITNFLINLPQNENETNQDPFAPTYKDEIENCHMFLERISNNFMIHLLPYFEFKNDSIQSPEWQFFDTKVLHHVMDSCTDPETKLINVKRLHQRLCDELKSYQNTAVMGQIQSITHEIPKVLKYALELNKIKERYASVVEFVKGWCQLAEILMIFIPNEILSPRDSQWAGICFLTNLLKRMVKLQLLPECAQSLSGAVVIILENLRRCHDKEFKQQMVNSNNDEMRVLQMHYGVLKDILESLIEWIIVSNATDEKLRVNLYTSLAIMLELANIEKPETDNLNSTYVSRLDNIESKQNIKMTTNVLSKFGERLVQVLCQDCVSGYEVSKMLALSSFGTLITLSGNINWIIYMSTRGYLKFIIESIMASDKDLETLLDPESHKLKPLYTYMSKIGFLGRLATTRVGAELLLEQNMFSCFCNMNIFNFHPNISKNWRYEDSVFGKFAPTTEERYLQIWLPTLHMCNAILTTLGTDNKSAVTQIMYYLLSQFDVIDLILRSGSTSLSISNLQELSLLTSIIARTATNDLINILESPDVVHNLRAQLYRIQKLTLALLPKFILTDDIVKDLVNNPIQQVHTFQTSERLLLAMQIIANLLTYARNVVANNDIQHTAVGILFQPTLKNPTINNFDISSNNSSSNEQLQSLGVVIQQLITTVNYHHHEKFTFDLLNRKLKEIPSMDSTYLEEFMDETKHIHDISVKKELVYDLISDRLAKKKKEIDYCLYIIENAMYLIWVHLDYYMLKSIPKTRPSFGNYSSLNETLGTSLLASSTEATWKVSTDDISNLKHGLVSIFNDSFTKQLLETIQDQTELDKSFVETLLKKIIRLIQFVPVK